MQHVKQTSFLDAVAAAIQHEKDFFDFCMKTYDELSEGPVRNLFFDLAEDSEDHIELIERIYADVNDGKGLPNMKSLGEVYKFQATAIQRLMRRLDRNKKHSTQGNEYEALRLAVQEAEDARDVFEKWSRKFSDPSINTLFRQMANFNTERAAMLEGCMVFTTPQQEQDDPSHYYLQEHDEVQKET